MDKKVTIYSTPTCHFCHAAKDFFQEHGISYTEFNVASDLEKRQEMIERSGQMGVPVVVVGDTVIVGFDHGKISAALGIKE